MAGKVKSMKKAAAAGDGKPGFSLISNEKLVELYSTMMKCRMLASRARSLAGRSRAASGIGREASIAGVVAGLKPGDTIGSSNLDYLTGFAKGSPLKSIVRELLAAGAKPGDASSKHLGTGTKHGAIAVDFCDRTSASATSLEQALQSAASRRLPVLFVRLNRAPVGRARRKPLRNEEDLSAKAKAFGVPAMHVDGNDVVAVYRVAHEAIVRARLGRGPTLIECMQDGASGSVAPIAHMERYLAAKGLFEAGMKKKIVAEFRRELDAAVADVIDRRDATTPLH